MFDGSLFDSWVGYIYAVAFAVIGHRIESRRNPMPPLGRQRRDGRMPFIAFWNILDSSVFTPEAIRFQRRALKALPIYVVGFFTGWLILDFFL